MKRVNPIVVLMIAITIFIIALFLVTKSTQQLEESYNSYKEFRTISNRYISLKASISSKKETIKLVNKIIKSTKLKNVLLDVKSKKIIIKASNQDIHKIDKFINKILNKNLKILKLNFTQNSVDMVIGY